MGAFSRMLPVEIVESCAPAGAAHKRARSAALMAAPKNRWGNVIVAPRGGRQGFRAGIEELVAARPFGRQGRVPTPGQSWGIDGESNHGTIPPMSHRIPRRAT